MKRMLCVLALFGVLCEAYAQIYYTGDGGKGIRIAVVPPEGKGLGADETWMPALVQGMLITNLTRYSAMTVIDRRNMEEMDTIPAEITGYYSEENYARIGKAANVPYILTGAILKTGNTYVLQLAVFHAETGERRASYRSMSTIAAHFENGDTVNDAVPALLSQLGVTLTDAGKAALETARSGKPAKSQTALAKGIIAQRNGKALEALSWYIQAADADPTSAEAAKRLTTITAAISGGAAGAEARNDVADIAWRRHWIVRLTECEQYYAAYMSAPPPFNLVYSPDLQPGRIDSLRRVHTPPFRAKSRGMYPESKTSREQHTSSL